MIPSHYQLCRSRERPPADGRCYSACSEQHRSEECTAATGTAILLAALERLLPALGPLLVALGLSSQHWGLSWRPLECFNTRVLAAPRRGQTISRSFHYGLLECFRSRFFGMRTRFCVSTNEGRESILLLSAQRAGASQFASRRLADSR